MLARMFRALKLDGSVYEEVEHDQGATGQAAVVVILVSLLGSVGALFGPGGIKAALFAIISSLLGWVVMSFVSLGIGKMLGGKANLGEMLRALGFAYSPKILGLIPFIGWLLAFVLGLIAWVQALKASLDLSMGKAILTGVLAWIAFLIISFPIAMLFGLTGLVGEGG